MKHEKNRVGKRAARKLVGEFLLRAPVRVGRECAEESAEFVLGPFLASGLRGKEFGGIAVRVSSIWAVSSWEVAGMLEKYYGKVDGCRLLRESSKPLHSAGLVLGHSKSPKKLADWILLHFEKLPPLLHEDFVFLQALSSQVDTENAMPHSSVKKAFARAFSENPKLRERLERYLKGKGVRS